MRWECGFRAIASISCAVAAPKWDIGYVTRPGDLQAFGRGGLSPHACPRERRNVTGKPLLRLPSRCGRAEWEILSIQRSPMNRKVLVDPVRRLAFCGIPKVATTQFRQLINRLNRLNVYKPQRCCGNWEPKWLNASYSICPYDSVAGHFNITRQQFQSRCSGWKLAAFVRDPLERFLSAFVDKCTMTGEERLLADQGDNCAGNLSLLWLMRQNSLEKKVEAFERMVGEGVPGWAMRINDHWRLQSQTIEKDCGFPLGHVDFLGFLSSNRAVVNSQVQQLLHGTYGLSAARAKGHADRFFPHSGYASQQNRGHSHAAHRDIKVYFRRKETLDAVMRFLHEDYQRLKIPIPSWTSWTVTDRTSNTVEPAK